LLHVQLSDQFTELELNKYRDDLKATIKYYLSKKFFLKKLQKYLLKRTSQLISNLYNPNHLKLGLFEKITVRIKNSNL